MEQVGCLLERSSGSSNWPAKPLIRIVPKPLIHFVHDWLGQGGLVLLTVKSSYLHDVIA